MNAAEFREALVGEFADLNDPDCREFKIGVGDWPFRGFVVRRGDEVYAYQNVCMHAGHPLNYKPDSFLTRDGTRIICASHGALYEIESGVCVAGPCPGKKLRAITVEVRDGRIFVRGPESA